MAFFAFTMAVWLANQVVFMVNIPESAVHPALGIASVAKRLNQAGWHFSIGMRAFLFAVPLVFWLFAADAAGRRHPRFGIGPAPAGSCGLAGRHRHRPRRRPW